MERFKGKIEGVPVEDELELGIVRGWNGHENEGNIQRIKIASSKLRWHLPLAKNPAYQKAGRQQSLIFPTQATQI